MSISVECLSKPDPGFAAFTYPRLAKLVAEPRPSMLAIGAFDGDSPAGLALGDCGPGDGRLLSLMVDRRCRGMGIATQLMRAFASAAGERGIRRIETHYPDHLASRPALEAALSNAGWSEPNLGNVQIVGLAGAMSDVGGRWPGVRRLLERPEPYAFTPWSERTARDEAAVERCLGEGSDIRPPDPLTWRTSFDLDLSFVLRRGGDLVGWLIGQRAETGFGPETTSDEAVSVHYPAAYCAEAHSRSGILIAGYHQAFSRQAELYGPRSRASYRTHPGARAMLALTMRRFAPLALRVDRVFTSRLHLAGAD
ncbi:GNAT family N-acetyltransferase [uncultured Aureimonas sp.]|uniref:GNAT family N-acetyltransferase n=1 Tax=uncultured Aureimonas sp. TaxID=1604662 RepID=UPI0025DE9985|nr:GNAT family N-acetyltransferase [uncultured Aureimonas sp.]